MSSFHPPAFSLVQPRVLPNILGPLLVGVLSRSDVESVSKAQKLLQQLTNSDLPKVRGPEIESNVSEVLGSVYTTVWFLAQPDLSSTEREALKKQLITDGKALLKALEPQFGAQPAATFKALTELTKALQQSSKLETASFDDSGWRDLAFAAANLRVSTLLNKVADMLPEVNAGEDHSASVADMLRGHAEEVKASGSALYDADAPSYAGLALCVHNLAAAYAPISAIDNALQSHRDMSVILF